MRLKCRQEGWWGNRYKLLGPGRPEGVPGPGLGCKCFIFHDSIIICRSYKFNPIRPSPSPCEADSQSFRFLTGPPLLEGSENLFYQAPNPLSAAMFMWRKDVILVAPGIPDLRTKCLWVVCHSLRQIYPRERAPAPIANETGWAPDRVWTFWRREKLTSLPI